MTERYDHHAARHYAAFRPPLHRLALDRVLGSGERFGVGLDVGCGTGYSTAALAAHCERVFGIDPSPTMLQAAQPHPRVTYLPGSGESLGQVPVPRCDIVTFAGSLFYAKSDGLRRELARVCQPGGTLVIYDFEILLDEVLGKLEVKCPAVASEYDHRLNVSDWPEFERIRGGTERVRLEVTVPELAHVLLADSYRYDALSRRFASGDPFESLVRHLERSGPATGVEADLYFTRYRVPGGRD